MTRETDTPKSFDLDLKLKVTEPFKGQEIKLLTFLLLMVESLE